MNFSYLGILRLSAPLILSMSGFMLMQFVDALFLSWYSAEAIAAVVPAGMAAHLLYVTFMGTAGYTSVLVSQYWGAKQHERIAPIVWQGNYFALAGGVLLAGLSLIGTPLFVWVGHATAIQSMEVAFFTIVCLGAPLSLPNQSLSGFFTGRGETRLVMFVQIIGILFNALLDYLLIFGPGPFPRLGIVGAGIATVSAQAVVTLLLLWCFLSGENRSGFGTWTRRAFDRGLTWQLVRFGVPNGSRFTVEVIAWTVFIFFVGRLGTLPLTATNIAWRINGIAFFPIIGLSQAVGILVGNAQGQGRSDVSVDVTRKGLLLGEAWMVSAALFFVLFPRQLYGLFHDPATASPQYFAELAGMGVILLRFVALYSLLDGFNIILLGTLQSAGDTVWTLVTSAGLHVVFIAALVAADVWAPGVMLEWSIATAFVMLQAMVWLGRFLSGKWRHIQVVESGVGGVG